MNVHHLELFFYVAKHRGVSAAARHMPYGIQQPAISAQILQLEDSLGSTLFHRRPFKLTKEGEQLYKHIGPFFGGLGELGNSLRGGTEKRLRIAAPEIVQRDYLPGLLLRMQKRVPGFQFTLTPGRIEEIEGMLLRQEIDIGFSSLNAKRSEDLRARALLSLPLVLLVPKNSRYTKIEDIIGKDRIDVPLITLPSADPLSRLFQEGLRKRKVDWFASLEVSSLDIISRYVAEGFGVGLSLSTPKQISGDQVRQLPLNGFPAVEFGAMWLGRLSPVAEVLLEEAKTEAVFRGK
jgi:DNA-binding transcriptional LysR family regulator